MFLILYELLLNKSSLDKKEHFFGFESVDLLVNLISIIAKNYIFKCKLNEQRLNIVEFKHKIMWYRSLEQYTVEFVYNEQAYNEIRLIAK